MAHASRRQKIEALLAAECIDALLVTNPINVTYLTNFTGDSSYLIVTPSGRFWSAMGGSRFRLPR